jgi:hypothetical protein
VIALNKGRELNYLLEEIDEYLSEKHPAEYYESKLRNISQRLQQILIAVEKENTINDGELAYVVSKIAYAHGRLESENRLSEKNFSKEIAGLEEANQLLQDVFAEDIQNLNAVESDAE